MTMGVLITQILVTILSTLISIIALRKDERSRTHVLKKEVSIIKPIVYIIAAISISSSITSYVTTNREKRLSDSTNFALKKNLDTSKAYIFKIIKQNIELNKAFSDSSLAQSRLITTSQEKSANQLTTAASNLSKTINGSDLPPIFTLILDAKQKPLGLIDNNDTLPIIGFNTRIINFINIQKCGIQYAKDAKVFFLNRNCVTSNEVDLGYTAVMPVNGETFINLPKLDSSPEGKFVLEISMKDKIYYEQAMYKLYEGKFQQSTRIILLSKDDKKIVKRWIPGGLKGRLRLNVDWNKEFPDKYFENLMTVDY